MTVSFNLCKTKIPSVFDIYTNKTNLCSHFSLRVYVLIKLEKQRIIIVDCDTDPNYSIVSARKNIFNSRHRGGGLSFQPSWRAEDI